ncbi:hypothetical protein EV126DRAFT_186879 [Verticillium dahliae]|nr:hypothetical protein EV126DRAFT_186879 [Verticillium dahliae]
MSRSCKRFTASDVSKEEATPPDAAASRAASPCSSRRRWPASSAYCAVGISGLGSAATSCSRSLQPRRSSPATFGRPCSSRGGDAVPSAPKVPPSCSYGGSPLSPPRAAISLSRRARLPMTRLLYAFSSSSMALEKSQVSPAPERPHSGLKTQKVT